MENPAFVDVCHYSHYGTRGKFHGYVRLRECNLSNVALMNTPTHKNGEKKHYWMSFALETSVMRKQPACSFLRKNLKDISHWWCWSTPPPASTKTISTSTTQKIIPKGFPHHNSHTHQKQFWTQFWSKSISTKILPPLHILYTIVETTSSTLEVWILIATRTILKISSRPWSSRHIPNPKTKIPRDAARAWSPGRRSFLGPCLLRKKVPGSSSFANHFLRKIRTKNWDSSFQ